MPQKESPNSPVVGQPKYIKACNVYCNVDGDSVVVAAVHNYFGSGFDEIPNGSVLLKLSDTAAIDDSVSAALNACEFREEFGDADGDANGWPAFEASGVKTMKQFESAFVRLGIKGTNEKNLSFNITSPTIGKFGLHLNVSVNARDANYGEAIRYIVKQYLACKNPQN